MTTLANSARHTPQPSRRLRKIIGYTAAYAVLIAFGFLVIFPFLVMLGTSLKTPQDTFVYPPRLLPREPVSTQVQGYDEALPLYLIAVNGQERQMALVENTVRVGRFVAPDDPATVYELPLRDVQSLETSIFVDGEEREVFSVPLNGATVAMALMDQTALGRFVDPADPTIETLANVRLSQPVSQLTAHPENYSEVLQLNGMARALTNTALVTILVVLGQLATSVLGGYAFARLRFPGRDTLFVLYLGTIMIPFVVLIMPLYQLMTLIGWVDRLPALIIPWIFTAYGTFLMRQFFITIPREIEEAALIDGASRLEILWRIFIPAATPALATLATFTFLYAWNSFFWPLVIINTGNTGNHVLTLALNVLRGRAADSPNLVLAGAAISVLPPMIIFILAQRFFIESATSSGVKG